MLLPRNSLILIAAIVAIFMKPYLSPGQIRAVRQPDRSTAWVTASHFVVKADANYLGGFRSLSGMSSGLNARESNGKAQRNFGSVTLSGGELQFMPFFDRWRQQAAEGRVAEAQRNVTITAYNSRDKEIARYVLVNAWPISVSASGEANGSHDTQSINVSMGYEGIQIVPQTDN